MKRYLPIDTFPEGIRAIFTSAHDGSIAAGGGNPDLPEHTAARETIIQKYFHTDTYAKVFVTYSPEQTYTHVERLTKPEKVSIYCDAMYTTEKDAVIVLPVADCIATIVYDPVVQMFGVLHLGRHASVAGLIESFAIEVADVLGSDPRDWYVWMSPSLKPLNDRMQFFDPPYPDDWQGFVDTADDGMIHIDTTGHNIARFERLGVQTQHIYASQINTYTDKHYFSQRAANELHDETRKGRMMVAASMTDAPSLLQ
jgi:copper oxidase (laccase) domain-containing protein